MVNKKVKLTKNQKEQYERLKGGTITQYEPMSAHKNTRYVGRPETEDLEAETVDSRTFSKFSQLDLVARIAYSPLIIVYRVK